jgi:hypothetical protein
MSLLNVQLALTRILLDHAIPDRGWQTVAAVGITPVRAEPDVESALSALSAVDAVSLDEAEFWRENFRKLLAVPAEAVEKERDRLQQLAIELVEELRQVCAANGGADREHKLMRTNFTLEALHRIGLLSQEEFLERVEELDRLLGFPEETDDLVEGPQLSHVGRVIVGPAKRIRGMRITTIALCDDGLVVQWQRIREGDPANFFDEDDDDSPAELEAEDDLGTEYEPYGGGSGGGDGVETGDETFGPAVPGEATSLRISLEGEAWEIRI